MSIQQRLTGKTLGVYLGLDQGLFRYHPTTAGHGHFRRFRGRPACRDHAQSRQPHTALPARHRNPQRPPGFDRVGGRVSPDRYGDGPARDQSPNGWEQTCYCRVSPDLTGLPPMTRLFFGAEAVLVVQAENLPCQNPGKIIQDSYSRPGLQGLFPKAGLHLRGLVACVERPGIIMPGDPVRVEIPQQTLYAPL